MSAFQCYHNHILYVEMVLGFFQLNFIVPGDDHPDYIIDSARMKENHFYSDRNDGFLPFGY